MYNYYLPGAKCRHTGFLEEGRRRETEKRLTENSNIYAKCTVEKVEENYAFGSIMEEL